MLSASTTTQKATLAEDRMKFNHASARDEKESTAQEPIIIKEHIFVISDDPVQDYDSVHHTQLLMGKYLTDDLQLHITKLHEFTADCAAQYKSRHCNGDLSCSQADFGFTIRRNFFDTSHAKGEQDAGSHVKQQASLAVVRGTASITNAKDLFYHQTSNFSKAAQSSFPSRSKSVILNRRIFFTFHLRVLMQFYIITKDASLKLLRASVNCTL